MRRGNNSNIATASTIFARQAIRDRIGQPLPSYARDTLSLLGGDPTSLLSLRMEGASGTSVGTVARHVHIAQSLPRAKCRKSGRVAIRRKGERNFVLVWMPNFSIPFPRCKHIPVHATISEGYAAASLHRSTQPLSICGSSRAVGRYINSRRNKSAWTLDLVSGGSKQHSTVTPCIRRACWRHW